MKRRAGCFDSGAIELAAGVPALRVRQASPAKLEVRIDSVTPNFEAYQVRLNDGPLRTIRDDRVCWMLEQGENKLAVRSRNLFEVLGPEVTASVLFRP